MERIGEPNGDGEGEEEDEMDEAVLARAARRARREQESERARILWRVAVASARGAAVGAGLRGGLLLFALMLKVPDSLTGD